MHWRFFFALCLVALSSAAPSMNLEASGDESGNDILRFHSSLEVDRQWLTFKSTYDKSYEDDDEELLRKKIFAENLKTIEEHNQLHAKGLKTFTLGVNQFADMEEHEFVKQKTCVRIENLSKLISDPTHKFPKVLGELPDSVDWRESGAVTPVKNQGNCGSCWAFSAVGALESHNFLKTQELVSLSEQNLVDCAGDTYGNHGCDGGQPTFAFEYVSNNQGIDLEESYPYEAKNGTCRYSPASDGGNCTTWYMAESGSEESLKAAVATYGPVSVLIDCGHKTLELYKGGVYNEPRCNATNLSHAVLLVGYGSTDTEPKIDYWIIKNSWSTGWGIEGYGLMVRNRDNNCGIATLATFPVV